MNGGVVIVEGNIGAGKSTFAKALAEALGGEYIAEPDETTNPYLKDYYESPARWAFAMQMFLLTRRYRAHKYAQSKVRHSGGFVVLDRSYYGDVCFANVQRHLGYFSERDYNTYLSHHADMKNNLEPPSMAFFLEVDAATCKARIEQRMREKAGRAFESSISRDYLERLSREIDWLADVMAKNTVVMRLPWVRVRTHNEIARECDAFAIAMMNRNLASFDFWTGAAGIGR